MKHTALPLSIIVLFRSKEQVHSILDDIPKASVPTRRKALMRTFQSLWRAIREAAVEELAQTAAAMNEREAPGRVYEFFHKS